MAEIYIEADYERALHYHDYSLLDMFLRAKAFQPKGTEYLSCPWQAKKSGYPHVVKANMRAPVKVIDELA